MTDLKQNLPKIAPQHSTVHEKQAEIVKLVKKFEVRPTLHWNVNQNIPGLRKKRMPFARKPSSHRWYRKFHSFERNGVMNWMVSANWTRLVFPMVFLFYCMYCFQPVMHGSVYINQFNNWQFEAVYAKLNSNRIPMQTQTITRIA